MYYGAHTGRWSGRATQPHNLTRKETDQNALSSLLAGGNVQSLAALSTCIRPCIRAPKGRKLVVADLSAIENRVLAWLSGCDDMLDVYAKGLDPYLDFGRLLFNKKYDEVTKSERQLCKPAVLGCGYGLGGGRLDPQYGKTGLWGYAEGMGVDLTQDQAHEMVNTFRFNYREVVEFWDYMEEAFMAAYSTHKEQMIGFLYFHADRDCVKILLPSGRYIHYLNPKCWDEDGNTKITFDGLRQGGWGRQSTWGGRITENVVQAVARDVLAEGMLRADSEGLTLVGHVHDELIGEEDGNGPRTPNGRLFALCQLEEYMTIPIDWAPGLPLAAEGYESEFYTKQ